MPRHEPTTRDTGEPSPDGKVVVRRDANGNLVPVLPKRTTTPETKAVPRPDQPDDLRSGLMRNVPPYGGA